MKITKKLLCILLLVTLLVGCAAVPQTQPGTTQNMEQPSSTATQPSSTVTQPSSTATQPSSTVTQPATQPPATQPPKQVAPDFTVYDAEGNEVKLSDFIGEKVILNFWASWCAPCLSELPHFQKKYDEYGDQIRFLFVNVTVSDTREDADAVLVKWGYTFDVLYDTEASAMEAYNISGIPATYLIDEEGYIVKSVVGSLSKKELQKLIDLLLAS